MISVEKLTRDGAISPTYSCQIQPKLWEKKGSSETIKRGRFRFGFVKIKLSFLAGVNHRLNVNRPVIRIDNESRA